MPDANKHDAVKHIRPRTPHEEALWQAWGVLKGEESSDTARREARDFIARSYEPLVRSAAQMQMRKSPYNFSMDDLVQAGTIGLLNAIDRFDPALGNQFSTFAPLRIRGAILDEINTLDWTPRGVREKLRAVIKATEIHHRTNEIAPTDEQLMELTELTKSQVREARLQLNKTYVTSIDASAFLALETRTGGSVSDFVGSGHNGPINTEDYVESKHTMDVLYTTMKKVLTENEATVVLLNFFEGMTLRDIATRLNMPAAKVSLVRKNGLRKLRDSLGEDFVQEFNRNTGR